MSTYSIDRLWDLRRKAEDDAAIALQRASVARDRAREAYESLRQAAARARSAFENQRRGPPAVKQAASEAVARHRYLGRLSAAVDKAVERVRRHQAEVLTPAQQAVEAAQRDYARARREREVVDRHRERERAAERLAADRRDENERDDRAARLLR